MARELFYNLTIDSHRSHCFYEKPKFHNKTVFHLNFNGHFGAFCPMCYDRSKIPVISVFLSLARHLNQDKCGSPSSHSSFTFALKELTEIYLQLHFFELPREDFLVVQAKFCLGA